MAIRNPRAPCTRVELPARALSSRAGLTLSCCFCASQQPRARAPSCVRAGAAAAAPCLRRPSPRARWPAAWAADWGATCTLARRQDESKTLQGRAMAMAMDMATTWASSSRCPRTSAGSASAGYVLVRVGPQKVASSWTSPLLESCLPPSVPPLFVSSTKSQRRHVNAASCPADGPSA